MFVVSERNIIIPGPGGEKFHMPRKFMGRVPDWVEKSAYFKALVKDGKIIISESGRDKDVDAALKGKSKGKGGRKAKPSMPTAGDGASGNHDGTADPLENPAEEETDPLENPDGEEEGS